MTVSRPLLAALTEEQSKRAITAARRTVVSWYRKHARDLPWRRSRDPYRIWVSEIMLQQTRVETAIPYFERFLLTFPSILALARASEDEVLAHWSGLGYYRRARDLHRAAKNIQESRKGLPSHSADLMRLPGIGVYTSAAIASIAFSEVIAAVDGNVERTLARWLAIRRAPQQAAAKRRIKEAAYALLSRKDPGLSNQALMEIGAVVCTPRRPSCGACPLRRNCQARILGLQEELPATRDRRATRRHLAVAALIRRPDGSVLLCRRSESEKWMPGLWEIPWAVVGAGDGLRQAEEELWSTYRLRVRLGKPLAAARHAITEHRFEVNLRSASLPGGFGGRARASRRHAWFRERELAALARTGLTQKLLRAAASG